MTMTAIILAGGMASRMGGACDKAFLEVDSEPIVVRQLRTLRHIFREIVIVTNSPDHYPDMEGVKVVSDVFIGKGPLGGLHAGLLASGSEDNFVLACDMPFVNEELVRYIVANHQGFDIVVPKIDNNVHPLFGVYSKTCLPVIGEQIERNDLRMQGLFDKLRTKFLGREDLERFDYELRSLVNINTPQDLAITEKKKQPLFGEAYE